MPEPKPYSECPACGGELRILTIQESRFRLDGTRDRAGDADAEYLWCLDCDAWGEDRIAPEAEADRVSATLEAAGPLTLR